jgi:hypothetical protein
MIRPSRGCVSAGSGAAKTGGHILYIDPSHVYGGAAVGGLVSREIDTLRHAGGAPGSRAAAPMILRAGVGAAELLTSGCAGTAASAAQRLAPACLPHRRVPVLGARSCASAR